MQEADNLATGNRFTGLVWKLFTQKTKNKILKTL
jgi:hypothetical protein